jgi:translation initiation factor IF-1
MDKKEKGSVIEALPSLKFRVQFDDERIMFCYLAGRMHKNFVRVLVGDKVEVVIPPQGNIGRIVKRF